MPLHATARAKINLALHVTGQRADGYHTLSSLVAFADHGDRLTLAPAATDTLTVAGPFAHAVPALGDNSLGAALATVRSWGLAAQPLHIHLEKTLPVASGIGGGSADAAALIGALTAVRQLGEAERADCLALGADVPMCLLGRPAIAEGIGERLTPVSLPCLSVVLVNPGVAVSTPQVFKALARRDNPPLPPPSMWATAGDLLGWLATTRNDLETPARSIEPAIGAVMDALAKAPFARMSGSGATCFALFEDEVAARQMADGLAEAHPGWWVVATRLSAG